MITRKGETTGLLHVIALLCWPSVLGRRLQPLLTFPYGCITKANAGDFLLPGSATTAAKRRGPSSQPGFTSSTRLVANGRA